MEYWLRITEFPRYSVSDQGRVRNDQTGRLMIPALNQLGIPHVGLNHGGVNYRRSLAPLVARAFLRPHHQPAFDTPINLNGDREDNAVGNLMWRPRWFSVAFHRQFRMDRVAVWEEIIELDTGEIFKHSREVVVRFGLLDFDVAQCIEFGKRIWPTHQRFGLLRTYIN